MHNTTLPKPRIRKSRVFPHQWSCFAPGFHGTGRGTSAEEAYQDWLWRIPRLSDLSPAL